MLADEELEEDTLSYVHQRISLAVKSMAAAILDNGIDVDMAAEFSVDFGDEGEAAESGTDNE